MQQVLYHIPLYCFVVGRCLPAAGLFLALMVAAAPVAAQQTEPTVSIVAASDEVDEGEDVVFTLMRAEIDLDSSLTVTVRIEEPEDDNRVLAELLAPSTMPVTFEEMSTTMTVQLSTQDDDVYEPHTTVMAVLVPSADYHVSLPSEASVLVRDDDVPVTHVFPATTQTSVNEGAGEYLFSMVAETDADERPRVGFYISVSSGAGINSGSLPGYATSPEDYAALSVVVRFPSTGFGRVRKLVEGAPVHVYRASIFVALGIVDDELMEGDERMGIDVEITPGLDSAIRVPQEFAPSPPNPNGAIWAQLVTIVDNDGVTIEAVTPEVVEGDDLVFRLTRPGGDLTPSLAVTVEIDEEQDNNRVLAEPLAPSTMLAVFKAGEASTTVQLATQNDFAYELHTVVRMTVLPGEGYYLSSPSSAAALVLDNDFPRTVIGLADTNYSYSEGTSEVAVEFVVTFLEGPPPLEFDGSSAFEMDLLFTGITATVGEDLVVLDNLRVSIPYSSITTPSAVVHRHRLRLTDDQIVEGIERVRVTMSRVAVPDAITFAPNEGQVTILDNDALSLAFVGPDGGALGSSDHLVAFSGDITEFELGAFNNSLSGRATLSERVSLDVDLAYEPVAAGVTFVSQQVRITDGLRAVAELDVAPSPTMVSGTVTATINPIPVGVLVDRQTVQQPVTIIEVRRFSLAFEYFESGSRNPVGDGDVLALYPGQSTSVFLVFRMLHGALILES